MSESGAMGVDDLRWTEPVRPGIGLVRNATTTLNRTDEAVMEFTGVVLFERRGSEAERID